MSTSSSPKPPNPEFPEGATDAPKQLESNCRVHRTKKESRHLVSGARGGRETFPKEAKNQGTADPLGFPSRVKRCSVSPSQLLSLQIPCAEVVRVAKKGGPFCRFKSI